MAWRGDHFDTEALGIEQRRDGGEDLDFAAVAAAAVDAVDVGGAADVLQQGLLQASGLLIQE